MKFAFFGQLNICIYVVRTHMANVKYQSVFAQRFS